MIAIYNTAPSGPLSLLTTRTPKYTKVHHSDGSIKQNKHQQKRAIKGCVQSLIKNHTRQEYSNSAQTLKKNDQQTVSPRLCRYVREHAVTSRKSSLHFSSRWYLCPRKGPYALHPVSLSEVSPTLPLKQKGARGGPLEPLEDIWFLSFL